MHPRRSPFNFQVTKIGTLWSFSYFGNSGSFYFFSLADKTSKKNIQCYLKSVVKQDFVNELKQITLSENFTFMYHFEYIKGDLTNLHVVISNGRQGLELKSKNETDLASFKSKTTSIFEKYNISFEHVEGFNMDKHSRVTIEIIEEQERDFLIGTYMKIKKNSS